MKKNYITVGFLLCAALGSLVLYFGADTSPTIAEAGRLFGLWRLRHVAASGFFFVLAGGFFFAYFSIGRLRNYLTVIFSILFIVALLEIVGHLGLVSYSSVLGPRENELTKVVRNLTPNIELTGESKQDTASMWRIPSEPLTFHYKTDRYGFRNHEDRENFEIVLVGDSFVVGARVSEEKVVNSILENHTGRKTIQAASMGVSPQQAQEFFTQSGVPFAGKIVVQFIFGGNDLIDSRDFRMPGSTQSEYTSESLIKNIWRILVNATDTKVDGSGLSSICHIDGQLYTFLWTGWSFRGFESEWEHIENSIKNFRDLVEKAGGHFLLVFAPSKLRVLGDSCVFSAESEISDVLEHLSPLRDLLLEFERENGIPVLDLTAPLKDETAKGNIPYFWGDTHWNEVGHKVAGEALANWEILSDLLDLLDGRESQMKVNH